jgi:hypothetical protein
LLFMPLSGLWREVGRFEGRGGDGRFIADTEDGYVTPEGTPSTMAPHAPWPNNM